MSTSQEHKTSLQWTADTMHNLKVRLRPLPPVLGDVATKIQHIVKAIQTRSDIEDQDQPRTIQYSSIIQQLPTIEGTLRDEYKEQLGVHLGSVSVLIGHWENQNGRAFHILLASLKQIQALLMWEAYSNTQVQSINLAVFTQRLPTCPKNDPIQHKYQYKGQSLQIKVGYRDTSLIKVILGLNTNPPSARPLAQDKGQFPEEKPASLEGYPAWECNDPTHTDYIYGIGLEIKIPATTNTCPVQRNFHVNNNGLLIDNDENQVPGCLKNLGGLADEENESWPGDEPSTGEDGESPAPEAGPSLSDAARKRDPESALDEDKPRPKRARKAVVDDGGGDSDQGDDEYILSSPGWS
ncbi:hypothetical protein DM02DRAFT_648953 [Periconia macrospinosa]|uniref:Uncharacterized protein n=1 Tax=Periconia macrospinosa TaxID=97972 RepID=A0A2V1EA15_9PLEO|nr:hypothetical protein DM02DRAFT_648953 [Periconia macrospinosa]